MDTDNESIEDNQVEDNLLEKGSDEDAPFEYSITSYGADYTVDGLVKRINNNNIYIPSFQRVYIWDIKRASRFIESFLLGLPVPGIFLAKELAKEKEEGSEKLLVIDGQQRLLTLKYFYNGIFEPTERKFALKGIDSKFYNKTYVSLDANDQLRLDDSILHATVIRQDEPSEDDSSIYHIFERLNTGGKLLEPQEIRSCLYHYKFNDVLIKLNKNSSWRSIFGSINKRKKDQELILRFFALYFHGSKYKRPMKGFLNKYMGKNKHLGFQSEKILTDTFEKTINIIFQSIGRESFKPRGRINAAVFDAVMVGVAKRLSQGEIEDLDRLKQSYQELFKNNSFLDDCESRTSQEDKVSNRIALATRAFGNI